MNFICTTPSDPSLSMSCLVWFCCEAEARENVCSEGKMAMSHSSDRVQSNVVLWKTWDNPYCDGHSAQPPLYHRKKCTVSAMRQKLVDDGYGPEIVRWSDGQVKLHFKLLCFNKQRQVFLTCPPIYSVCVYNIYCGCVCACVCVYIYIFHRMCDVTLHLLLPGSLGCQGEPGQDQKEPLSQGTNTRNLLPKVG